jgi:hypothetical protein
MTRDEILQFFLGSGERLWRAEEVGLPYARLADLDHFRSLVQTDLGAFLRTLDAPFEARRLALSSHALSQLAVLETTPDLFGPLDHIRAETLHTRVVAWALSPHRLGPGLGVEPLRAFLSLLARDEESGVNPEWADGAAHVVARPEWHVSGCGRIDVWLELPDAVFAIEAKVDAELRLRQLEDYQRAAERPSRGRKGHVVFLTLDPNNPASSPPTHRITFADLLTAWLPLAAAGRTGEHLYLGAWLRTLAHHLYPVSGSGPFHSWPRARRGRTLSHFEDHR